MPSPVLRHRTRDLMQDPRLDALALDGAALRQAQPQRTAATQQAEGAALLQAMEQEVPLGTLSGLPPAAAGGGYQAPAGGVPRINATRLYQQEGRGSLRGYLNNPLEEEGRQAIARQFLSAPLGGQLRSALQGQEVFGHRISNAQARIAEQAAAGVLATGVGSWGLLSAIDALNGDPQTPGTMPMG